MRAEVALPTVLAFVFGLACGVVITHALGSGRQAAPESRPSDQAAAANPGQPADEEAQLREALRIHEELLAEHPDDPRLLRTLADYEIALGNTDNAAQHYERAQHIAEQNGAEGSELAAILMGRARVALDRDDLQGSFEWLEKATAADPTDVRARISEAYLYLTRVMMNPPPGMDRRAAVMRVEELLDEVLEIDPQNADALEFQELIDRVRASTRGAPPMGGTPDAATAPAHP